MPGATASATHPVAVTLEESHSILPVESLPLYDTGIPHELSPTNSALTQGKAAYYCTQCMCRAQSRSAACTHVHCDHIHISISCPYSHKVWSGDAWKQHMCHAYSKCPWYVVAPTPAPSQQLVALPDDSTEEMTLEVPLHPPTVDNQHDQSFSLPACRSSLYTYHVSVTCCPFLKHLF